MAINKYVQMLLPGHDRAPRVKPEPEAIVEKQEPATYIPEHESISDKVIQMDKGVGDISELPAPPKEYTNGQLKIYYQAVRHFAQGRTYEITKGESMRTTLQISYGVRMVEQHEKYEKNKRGPVEY